MPVTFNPAGSLTANRVPYATGDGRLLDSALIADSGHLLVNGAQELRFRDSACGIYEGGGLALFTTAGSSRPIRFVVNGNECGRFTYSTGELLLGTPTNSGNGRVQLAAHSALTGGLAFGTSATGSETIWRHSAGVLRTDGQWQIGATNPTPMQWQSGITALRLGDRCSVESALVNALGTVLVRSSSRPSYGLPTGTATRTTFDPATVTLSQLAERVAAIIHDLSASNGTYHGLFA